LPPCKPCGYMPLLRRGIFPIIARIFIMEGPSPWSPQKCIWGQLSGPPCEERGWTHVCVDFGGE
jgi:hypothetical protein